MTRADAIQKIARLMRVANNPTTPRHEAESARSIAGKLASEHHVNEQDLQTAAYVAAYDEMVKDLTAKLNDRLSLSYSIFSLREVLDHTTPALSGVGDAEKVRRVRAIVKIVRGVAVVAGSVPAVAEVNTLVESVLRKYDITP